MADVRPLRIAWLGSSPLDMGGAPGVVTELLEGLATLGHQIDCFFPGSGRYLPERLAESENLTFVWGFSEWRWDRWYSRTPITAFVSGLLARANGMLRLRREIARRHRVAPYDVVYQNSTIESLAAPAGVIRSVPLVIRPDTHIAGELRWLLAERRLAFACQPRRIFFTAALVMSLRALVQRVRIRRAKLVICISRAFRDHLVHDYGFPVADTVVVPNPVRLGRFTASDRPVGRPARILVLGRVSVRKGVEDVVAVAQELSRRGADVHVRVVGGPSLWSDYTPLLAELPADRAEYVGRLRAAEIPAELAETDVLVQASKYEPFGLTVAEALAAGVPVVATSEVGAVEGVERSVVEVVAPGDVTAIANAIETLVGRLRENPRELREKARAEAERLFATDVVCRQISDALERLVVPPGTTAARANARATSVGVSRESGLASDR